MVCETCSQQSNAEARFCCHCGKPMVEQRAWSGFSTRLTRPRNGRMIGGVCAGIAQAYGLDPALVRVVAVVVLFCGFGSVGIAYLAAWLIIPNAPLLYVPVVPSQGGFAGSAPIS